MSKPAREFRVIVIDAEKREVRESTVSGLKDMQAIVGGYIERGGSIGPKGDEVFVNDEGLFGNPQHFFQVKGFHQPFAGNGFIIGKPTRGGNSTDAKMDLMAAYREIKFMSLTETREWAKGEQNGEG